MQTRGELRIDSGALAPAGESPAIELAVLYTEPAMTAALLRHAVALTAGLEAKIRLIAVHTVPYPCDFECPASVHAYLVEHLVSLAGQCPLPVSPEVVLARSREEGLQLALRPESTLLIASRKHFWRTAEEKLARILANDGHKVALVHVA
jgi:hypothetical protein